jgi:hypothetical protein
MIEAAEASIIMLDAMIARLMRNTLRSELASDAADTLEYRKRSFQSTLLRLHSLEKRMSNVIQLSFNLVTQADSGVMKADSAVLKTDSRAMKFIAFLTLVFLPATGVASVSAHRSSTLTGIHRTRKTRCCGRRRVSGSSGLLYCRLPWPVCYYVLLG